MTHQLPPRGSLRHSVLSDPMKLAREINEDVLAGADEIAVAIREAIDLARHEEREKISAERDERLDELLRELQASAVQVRDEMLISRSDWADILAKAFGYGLRK